jgi:hypothetical protein
LLALQQECDKSPSNDDGTGVGEVKQISILIVGLAAALAAAPALAEDFTAGKTPAQLFRSDCGACHHSPNGLVKERGDVGGLTAFLREHYTTKSDTAAALAAYVSGLASPGGRNRGPAGRERTRNRSEADAAVTTAAVPAERRRARDDGDAPRPPRGVGTGSRTHAPARISEPGEADHPIPRLRSYLSSGADSGNASAQATRTGAPKLRKRHTGGDEAGGRAAADAPPAPPAAAEPPARPDAPAEAAPDEPK